MLAAEGLDGARKTPGCAWHYGLSTRAFTPDEVWEHLRICEVCQARFEWVMKAAVELAGAVIPGCQWLEDRLNSDRALGPAQLSHHNRTCPTCRSRWETVRNVTPPVALGDWIPGCEWAAESLKSGTFNSNQYQQHLTKCAVCQTRLAYFAEDSLGVLGRLWQTIRAVFGKGKR